jgi:hypothetical protein
MSAKIGIILLDTTEVIFTVFQHNTSSWSILLKQTYDLTPLEKGQSLQAAEIIEVIANITFSQITEHVAQWKICARGIFEPLAMEIQRATSMPTELLTLSREQELLCKGLLTEVS